MSAEPTFPPLLSGHRLAAGLSPAAWTAAKAAKGQLGAGDLAWSEDRNELRLALILEPDVERGRCQEMIFVAMVAIGDSLGALCPPRVAFTYQWPYVILANDARAGSVDLVLSAGENGDSPDWMVLSLHLRLSPRNEMTDPGKDLSCTTLWDEGCGTLDHTEIVESLSRHLVNLIHQWSEDGFKSLYDQWRGRLSDNHPLAPEAAGIWGDGVILGVDETGNAILKTGETTWSVSTLEALEKLRAAPGAVS
ncbi:MAG: biotin/lipoate--protein ligase family protein [Hyphomicrobiales bacterium]|nr:biotin/lipoate--protein ligase family protein [Hyphomicrobiales bacterium]